MKKLMLLLALGLTFGVSAQEALEFDDPNYNFGEIKEQDGPVDHTFYFTNNTPDSLRILGVRASCGCTTPAWTKEMVAPGGQGSITARYNPNNRPGAFRKSLTVSTSNPSAKSVVYINGTVKPRPRTVEDDLPTKVDGIRVKYLSFNFGKISTKEPVTKQFDLYNDSEEEISLVVDKMELPSFVTLSFDPVNLAPKERGSISVTFDPTKDVELGFQSNGIKIVTTDSEKPKSFTVLATVEEYFAPLSDKELEKAPRLSFDKTSHNFGKLEKDAIVTTEFVLTNTGKSKLNLRKVSTNCPCTVTDIEKMNLKPGETTTMNVTFDLTKRRGRQYKSITVFSNDPTAPTQIVNIRAEVPRT